MVHEHAARVEAEHAAVRLGGRLERAGGHVAAGYAAAVEFLDVLQTARRTGSSVG